MDQLAKIFKLTPAETEVTRLLVAGMSVAECAQELGVSVHTVRCHLKKAMAKTGTNRQAQLIQLMLRNVSTQEFNPASAAE